MHYMCFYQGQMTFFNLTNTFRGNGFYYPQFNQFVDPALSSDRGLTTARLTGGSLHHPVFANGYGRVFGLPMLSSALRPGNIHGFVPRCVEKI